jgi:hypothetical protein
MVADRRQAEIFAAMRQPAFYPHPAEPLEWRETHISIVFLAGAHVYKVKKAVALGFLDYSSLELRRRCCQREVALNRRLSRGIYRAVRAVTLTAAGGYRLGGRGPAVEYVVCMRRLPEERSLTRLLHAKACSAGMIRRIAARLDRFYRQAEVVAQAEAAGGWHSVRENCEENFRQLASVARMGLDPRLTAIVAAATRAFLLRRRHMFENRLRRQCIRDGHGDLRCDHVYLSRGIQIIDCIEFNDRFRYGDVAADLGFLAMDIDFEGFAEISEQLMRAYVQRSGDGELFALLDFYKCYRAMVRAKVSGLRWLELDPASRAARRLQQDAARFLELSYHYALQMSRPTMWIVCGPPASGKSTLAAALAQALGGVVVLRLDAIRKQLFGLDPASAHVVPFASGIYAPEASRLAYGRLLLLAQEHLAAGRSAILDATFASRQHRDDARALARERDVNIVFIECRVSRQALAQRLREREERGDVSDARLQHLEELLRRFEPLTDMGSEIHLEVDTGQPLPNILPRLLAQDHALLSRQVEARLRRCADER